MGKIYSEQTDLTFRVLTEKDLTGISDVAVISKNPKKIEETHIATVVDAQSGLIEWSIESALAVVGVWTFWAKIVDAQGLISIGEPFSKDVYLRGT